MPGMTVVAPADDVQLASGIAASADYAEPIYIRIQRGRDPLVYEGGQPFFFGKVIRHLDGKDLVIIACGSMVHPALQAARSLNAKGHSVGLLDMATVKPIDGNAILEAATSARIVLTVEEHNVLGGLGGAVAEVIAGEGLPVKLHRHGIHDEYSLIAPPTHLYAHYKLDSAGIEEIAAGLLVRH